MNPFRLPLLPAAAVCVGFALSAAAPALESGAPASGSELAAKLSALQQGGGAYVRLRMEIKGATKETLQLQIKERRTKGASDVLYQVLFPKERKGEAVLLRKVGNRPVSGSIFTPPNIVRVIDDVKDSLLGSDLSYEDVIDNFFAWDQQSVVGTEEVEGVNCQILESKPGKGERSSYSSVRSWIDVRRLVPLRVEKYAGGQSVRRIDTTRVVVDEGRHIPANLNIRGARANSSTAVDGSKIKHGIAYTERDFTAEGMKDLTAPQSAP